MDEPMKLAAAALLPSPLATREPRHPPVPKPTARVRSAPRTAEKANVPARTGAGRGYDRCKTPGLK
jgi:hypothetical protein